MNGFISQHDIFIIQLYAITFVAIGFEILKNANCFSSDFRGIQIEICIYGV